MNLKLASDFEGYARQCIPAGAGQVQRTELELAFYGGAICMLHRAIEMEGSLTALSIVEVEIATHFGELITKLRAAQAIDKAKKG